MKNERPLFVNEVLDIDPKIAKALEKISDRGSNRVSQGKGQKIKKIKKIKQH